MDQNTDADARLFPNKTSLAIFWTYICLFVSQGLLVKAVHAEQIPGFDSTILVLFAEFIKLIICLVSHQIQHGGDIRKLYKDIKRNRNLFYLYFIPALLYCLYNNLTFVNLKLFDVTTYYCLMQLRIVVTAVVYQILFKRRLTRIQWISLLTLTVGCLIKQYGVVESNASFTRHSAANDMTTTAFSRSDTNTLNATNSYEKTAQVRNSSVLNLIFGLALVFVQMFCSCFAGVYNEYLLKDISLSHDADVTLQNIFMYIDSILCNIIAHKGVIAMRLHYSEPSDQVYQQADLTSMQTSGDLIKILLSEKLVVFLVLNNAISGLVASFFLKWLNSILKTFASALELFAVALLAWILFGDMFDLYTASALVLVSIALVVYANNPVSVAAPRRNGKIGDEEGFVLLPTTE